MAHLRRGFLTWTAGLFSRRSAGNGRTLKRREGPQSKKNKELIYLSDRKSGACRSFPANLCVALHPCQPANTFPPSSPRLHRYVLKRRLDRQYAHCRASGRTAWVYTSLETTCPEQRGHIANRQLARPHCPPGQVDLSFLEDLRRLAPRGSTARQRLVAPTSRQSCPCDCSMTPTGGGCEC